MELLVFIEVYISMHGDTFGNVFRESLKAPTGNRFICGVLGRIVATNVFMSLAL
jgi:hypothetical protein